MRSFEEMSYHQISERLAKVLCHKTQSTNPTFFRILAAYYFCKVASMMRAYVKTPDRGSIPINLYAVNLAPSGHGKGMSTNIMEEQVIGKFKSQFLSHTFPTVGEKNLYNLAVDRASKKGTDPDKEVESAMREFKLSGNMVFSFDSGTTAAVKQIRHKLLLAGIGSINMEIDEIGSNLLGQIDILTAFLELYDVGKIKQKLVKSTVENVRNEELDGRTPTNAMLYGTPAKLLNGSKTEEEFYSMLETGYARRCFFGYSRGSNRATDLTPEQVYDLMTDNSTNQFLEDLSVRLYHLADPLNHNLAIEMEKDVCLLMIEYRLQCEQQASLLPEHEDIRRTELAHRYFKAMKLAGAYAFIDGSPVITEEHLYNAIKLTEESGMALDRILTRERNYMKLANYIAEVGREVTHVDLVEDLPFYRGSASQKADLMTLAIAYGYKNNIIIKKSFSDGIEFLHGESLKKTDLSRMVVSYGQHVAFNYRNEFVPFDQLHKLTQADGFHWVAHHLKDGHRTEDTCIPGVNMLVFDVDGTIPLVAAKQLLKNYTYLIYTTKRHTPDVNRFRIVMPLNYTLQLDAKDYKEFIKNVFEWLPFQVDEQTGQRARKWLSHNGHYEYNEGELLDVLPFIPKTSKNEERHQQFMSSQSLDNLERWFIANTGEGNRSNQLVRYAMMLLDTGLDPMAVQSKVLDLNNKLPSKLEESEILGTIMITVHKAFAAKSIRQQP